MTRSPFLQGWENVTGAVKDEKRDFAIGSVITFILIGIFALVIVLAGGDPWMAAIFPILFAVTVLLVIAFG